MIPTRKGSSSYFDAVLYEDTALHGTTAFREGDALHRTAALSGSLHEPLKKKWSPEGGKRKTRAGFTLIEVMVVLIILAILSAVAVPTMIGFMERGKQVSRTNIARTLYLAAQNQLTKRSVEKNLKATMTGAYFQKDANGFFTDLIDDTQISVRNVAQTLAANGGAFPDEESANADYIHYISKPRHYTPPSDAEIDALPNEADKNAAKELRSFYNLLDEIIIDKNILDDAILLEYNVVTGVVLSVFYGDAGQTAFTYNDDPADRSNVTGGRGIENGYAHATKRKQGYYGGEATGEPQPVSFRDVTHLYDGGTKPLDTGFGENKVNVLYAEFLLAKPYQADGITEDAMPAYTFSAVNAKTGQTVITYALDLNDPFLPTNLDNALQGIAYSEIIYTLPIENGSVIQHGIDVSGYYNRYIWVLDYIDGDLQSGQPYSIGVKYTDGEGRPLAPQNIRAKASKGGVEVTSLSLAHTHFAGEMSGGRFEVKTARHLNNIRYQPGGHFRQTADIDMLLAYNEITNFAPIIGAAGESFSGEYYAMKTANTQYKISNLIIHTAALTNVGLFAVTDGTLQGVSLFNATVTATGSGNIGAIAGTMNGGTVRQCNVYARITASGAPANTGGLIGHIAGGRLEQSFNAGFFNAPAEAETVKGIGSVTANAGNAGGLAGLNNGTIINSFNNARVNVSTVSVDADGLSFEPQAAPFNASASLGGIAGSNTGVIENTYATNYVADGTGATTGGVTGGGTGEVKNSYFLLNGCTGAGAIGKDDMRVALLGIFTAFAKGADYQAGNNAYAQYPYPTLRNNNPFADAGYIWGWEDIAEEDVSTPEIVYYEIYDDGQWGYAENSLHPSTLAPEGSNKRVVNDGYAVELAYYSGGYKLVIGSRVFTVTASGTKENAAWTVTEEGQPAPSAWGAAQKFTTDDGDVLYRLIIPNQVGESEGASLSLKLYRGASTDIAGAAPKAETVYNPLFANQTANVIRSPRHLDNIDKAPGGAYTQELNLDFSLYYREFAAPGAKMPVFTEAVVTGAFTGTYNGQYKQIAHVAIQSTAGNVGLFATLSGPGSRVQGLSLYKATITATNSDHVGAIAGTLSGGTITQCNSYATVLVNSNKNTNTGGLVGRILSGTLEQSFNAGFYNAPDQSATPEGFGSVTANRGNVGGLVGLHYGTLQNSFNNARVNVNNVSVTRDGERLSYDPVFTPLTAKASIGGIAGYNNGGTIRNTYATNYVSLLTDFGSTYGGISGFNSGSCVLTNNYFLANGCPGNTGTETISKAHLRDNPFGALFTVNSTAGHDNTYKNYPYPLPVNHNPFAAADYDWVRYACGWEDIEDVRAGDTGLLYYELYDNGTTGFSGGNFAPLAPSASASLVTNDGYALDIAYTSLTMNVTIGTEVYTLTVADTATPSYTWSGASSDINAMVRYTDEGETRFLLFFNNNFLESRANGEAYIDFEVRVLTDTIISTRFNPLFANTVGRTIYNFSVRSPRHLDNVNRALLTDYSQGLNLDFARYRKSASFTAVTGGTPTGSGLDYDSRAVVSDTFAGDYNGNNLYISNLTARYGIFEAVGSGAEVKNITVQHSTLSLHFGKDIGIGGIAAQNLGTISGCRIQGNTAVTGEYRSYVGGITGVNRGTVTNCTLENDAISGANYVGGVAGLNTGTISHCKAVSVSEVANEHGGSQYIGGIAGANTDTGVVSDCTVEKGVIHGANYVGGIAGDNEGTIRQSKLISISSVTGVHSGSQFIGGIAGRNSDTGTLTDCVVEDAAITGSGNIGGVTGENGHMISGCSVVSSVITANNNANVGGVVGNNTGTVQASGVMYSTVSSQNHQVGGVAGHNGGTVTDVFFLSTHDLNNVPVTGPAWSDVGGIVGHNTGSVYRAFYYAPAPSRTSGNIMTIFPIVGGGNEAGTSDTGISDMEETCYYLAGYRYSLNEGLNWISTEYNRVHAPDETGLRVRLSGGGIGLVTKFIAKEWLEFAYEADLARWYQPTNGYPYPMPTGIAAPNKWPQTDSPTRPEQVDRPDDDWAVTEPTSNRGRNVTFINGDFAVGQFTAADCFEVVDNASRGRRIYIDMGKVPGWSTRPVGTGNTSQPARNYLIELQEPIGTSSINSGNYNSYMASNYNGGYNTSLNILTSPFRYAELNADVQGTLYQLCTTTPGAQFYYSFYHASRGAATDKMNFYLTGVGDNDDFADDNALTLIRPCWSPRQTIASTYNTTAKTGSNWGKTSLRWNPAVRNTVKYDNLGNVGSTVAPLTVGSLAYYADKFSHWPTNNNSQIYLYDVWIGNTTNSTSQTSTDGYGLTFWSTSNRSLAARGYTSLNNLYAAAPEAATNVIGYWGISYGWKHYYGLYEVPSGQNRTEFAYQSRTNNATNGNYLDGISFKSPAFLSIDKYIKDASGEDAKFVTLDDVLTVELHVSSYGEIMADNIRITDKLAPYDEYIDYVGNVTVKKGAATITGFTMAAPNAGNGHTLTLTLPAATTLAAGETLTVTFQIKVRQNVKSVPLETLLFYFKNQAEVSYNEDKTLNRNYFDGYINQVKNNASEILQVYIDPIKLSKTVTPDIDGNPFTVTLTVEDTLGAGSSIVTRGLITDLIPKGFSVVHAPAGAVLTQNADGSTRIIIQHVNLGTGTVKKLVYTYTLAYTGAGYGVAYTSVTADYKYQYIDANYNLSVMLAFPKNVVGISVKTQDDIFMVDGGTASQLLNITANDNFAEALADSNYDVTPEVVLLSGKVGATTYTPVINKDGNYQIDTPLYTAVLIRGSHRIEFTPKAGAIGSYELYYQIQLTATKAGNADFTLSSKETAVSVNVVGNALVYYEKYHDNTYGFYTGTGSVPQGLDDAKVIVESGYGVLSASPERSVQLGNGAVSNLSENYNGLYLYRLDTVPVANFNLIPVKFGPAGSLADMGKIYPTFAKGVYPTSASNAGNALFIRTPQQMRNISLVNTAGKTFTQEHDIPFDNIDLNADGAVVKGTFSGTFNGNGFAITDVTIDAPTTDNVGLFSQNSGTLRGVTLRPNTSIRGKDNVGGIAGRNLAGGVIEDCTVEGDPVTLSGIKIEGSTNVNGIAGLNDGEVRNCAVVNTA